MKDDGGFMDTIKDVDPPVVTEQFESAQLSGTYLGADTMRKFVRHPSDIPINISLDTADLQHHSSLQNLSQGGLCCDVDNKIAVGMPITITIPVVNPSYAGRGVVVWCKSSGDRYEIGIRFAEKQEAYETRMVEQVCQIEHYKSEVLRAEGRIIDGEQAAKEWIGKFAADFSQNLK